jgi:hypothetical protein
MKRYMYFVTGFVTALSLSGVLYAGDAAATATVIEKNGMPPAEMNPSAVMPAEQMKAVPMMPFDAAMKQPSAKAAEKKDPAAVTPMKMDQ